MNQPMIELPRYKSHKIVRALSIAAIEVHEDGSATIAPSLAAYAVFRTQPGWAERFKGNEEDKGYYVVYDDGYASWSPTKAFESGYVKVDGASSGLKTAARAQRLMEQVMKTWSPPRWAGKESLEVATQTSVMLTIAYLMGREFMPSELTANQRAAIDSGLVVLQNALDAREAADDESPTLEQWMEQWEAAIEAGQSSISREEAEKRYRKAHGRDHGHPNGEG